MAKSLPPLTWFRAFEATARHLSFTLAADELGFTQSAISQHVRALEDRLGTKLFVRGNRSLALTDAGRLLLPDVAAAMATLTSATQRFLPEQAKPTLTIATSASIAHWVLAPHLADFHQTHPDIAIQLVTTIWPDDFVSTNADIEIRFGPPSVVGRDAKRLDPSFLHMVAVPEIANSLDPQTDIAQIAQYRLIQPVGLSLGWSDIGVRLKSRQALDHDILVDTHGMAVDLALGGAGIALCHCLISKEAIKQGQLAALPFRTFEAKEGYYAARKSTTLPDYQSAFLDWLDALLER